jgi:hypothetical protein
VGRSGSLSLVADLGRLMRSRQQIEIGRNHDGFAAKSIRLRNSSAIAAAFTGVSLSFYDAHSVRLTNARSRYRTVGVC